ncbi:Undecaprenyl-phosphate galactose phosphotransferase, WbaP/exopolysaccharide biosynthesis polyprenyl glycosylphosphotransferase [Bryocella elongata]|uniref:Undecaprenyl-phosphate galactose phosphotransferase, WbaP/exopolysaccharide biosynthesis polyprenyl glycosylphosphotransferase n=1 Tax=Bryocella elongata TaxID=863522 RepID=A0A1H5T1Z1_9BACT|nr:sugar transferase [Bryocella elongata]SEF56843.1 Undecaprenyl-phosphate galactose phosphotransferase, WbaP/exopolysaccharide biosynthesis polyprenyl glycosylphosphotransferase [Bryocella elongata]
MTTPDYLEQVVVSNVRRRAGGSARRSSTLDSLPVGNLIWATLDFLSVIIAGLIAFRVYLPPTTPDSNRVILRHLERAAPLGSLVFLFIFGVYLLIFARVYGLYRATETRSGLSEARLTLQATLTAGLLICGTLYLTKMSAVSRVVVVITVFLTGIMLVGRRAVWRRVRERRYLQGKEVRNVLIVGNGRVGHALRNHLESLPHMGFRFKGFISLDKSEDGPQQQVLGDVEHCVALARSLFVDEIYFSTPADKQTVLTVVEDARATGIDVRVVPDLYDGLAWNAPIEYVGQFPTIPLHRRDFPRGAFILKRIMDVILSGAALTAVAPVMLAIAVIIKRDSKGPVFYKAARIGRKGRHFSCYKFRTMVMNADKLKADLMKQNERDGILFKMSNDPRITKIGAKLRKYSLDELPQFFNVLLGDMSLVGPRPPLASEVEQYDVEHLRRLDVLPGITGLWQVEARQDPSFDSYISLDTAYVENWNLWLDLRILARTVTVVLGGTGS